MENEHNLRNRKITTNVSQIDRTDKTTVKPIGTKSKPTIEVAAISSRRAPIARTSITKKVLVTPTAVFPPKNRISSAQPSNPSPATRENTLRDKFNSIEDRLKKIEDNIIQESRLSTIETNFNQLRSTNRELQLTVDRLKADIEGLQFVSVQLLASEDKVRELGIHCNRLSAENKELKSVITNLDVAVKHDESQKLAQEVSELKGELNSYKTSQLLAEKGISFEQQEINSNIVIRGVHVDEKGTDCQSEIIEVYDKIRAHLGILEISDLKAASATILQPKSVINKKSDSSSAKTILVKLPSVAAKRKFLQIRRVKKEILPSHIEVTQTSNKPILITEQLTRENQELLFKALSLRTSNKFKFVWSNDGQILARQSSGSRVIRIRDIDHINSLSSLNHLQQAQNGRLCSNTAFTTRTGDEQE